MAGLRWLLQAPPEGLARSRGLTDNAKKYQQNLTMARAQLSLR
ncbi:MAG: hypothetical protein ABI877_07715 [Gemmatimonadaceae bacterium]